MDRQAFFDRCWELNHEEIATNGGSVQSVQYILEDELEHRVIMEFYPVFYKEKIIEMPVVFTYEGWAPWNKEFSSDSLLVKLIPVFKKWYGDDFKLLNHETMGKVYVKMDGKRRINLFIRDDQYVQAVFSDLELLRERKKEGEEKEKKIIPLTQGISMSSVYSDQEALFKFPPLRGGHMPVGRLLYT